MISIIIPVFNVEKYIDRCLQSILNSSYQEFEIIIVDDGSSDNTLSIIKKYEAQDTRIKVISKINGGSASARNVGIQNAKGQYIAFIDADDYIHKDYLKILFNNINDDDIDIVECDFAIVYNDFEEVSYIRRNNNVRIINNIEKLKEFCETKTYLKSVVLWNKLYKKELFDGIFFVENKGIDDEYVSYKLFFKAQKIAIIDEKLYYYFMSENSQMRSEKNLKKLDSIDAIESQMIFFDEHRLTFLKEKLYYRYYRNIIDNIIFLKKYYPDEKLKMQELIMKRKKIYKAFFSRYVKIKEKIFLMFFLIIPNQAKNIQNYIKIKEHRNKEENT